MVGERIAKLFPRRGAARSFREIVDSRYRHDLVMNGFSAFLVMLVPIGVMILVYVLAGTDTAYGVMEDYLEKAVITCLALESFVMAVIMFRMYDRLCKHSVRDLHWMRYLIGFAGKKGADTSRMTECCEEYVSQERFRARPYALVLLLAMAVFAGWIIIAGVSRIDDLTGGNDDVTLSILSTTIVTMDVVHVVFLISMVMVLLMSLIVFVPSYLYPHIHEERQVRFTQALADSLSDVGISVRPMEERVRTPNRNAVVLITVFTAGYGSLLLMFGAFRYMNVHLLNQWDYEARLLVALHTDGRRGFDDGDITEAEVPEGGFLASVKRWYHENMHADVAYTDRMPPVLIITVLFLLALLANYVLKLIAIGCMIGEEIIIYDYSLTDFYRFPLHAWYNIGLVFMDLYFIVLMIDSILGIASRKAASWRKVVRCCFTVVVPLWYATFVTRVTGISHLFDFNVYITTAVMYDVLLLMLLSDRIKRYYTPIGYEMPGTVAWIKYAFIGDIFSFVVDRGALFPEDSGIPKENSREAELFSERSGQVKEDDESPPDN